MPLNSAEILSKIKWISQMSALVCSTFSTYWHIQNIDFKLNIKWIPGMRGFIQGSSMAYTDKSLFS